MAHHSFLRPSARPSIAGALGPAERQARLRRSERTGHWAGAKQLRCGLLDHPALRVGRARDKPYGIVDANPPGKDSEPGSVNASRCT